MREGFPKMRVPIRSIGDATAVFNGSQSFQLDDAIGRISRDNIMREGMQLDAARLVAREGGATALWRAVGSYNQLLINNALLGRQWLPHYSREEYEADARASGHEPSDQEYETILQRKQIAAIERRSSKQASDAAGMPPTIESQLAKLSKGADRTKRAVNHLVADLDYFSRTNLLNSSVRKVAQTAELEQLLLSEVHGTITRCRSALTELGNLERLAALLSESKSKGGAPRDVFHRTFVASMLPVWEELTGSPAKRDNRHVIDLLTATYFCFTGDDFGDWQSHLRTEVDARKLQAKGLELGSD